MSATTPSQDPIETKKYDEKEFVLTHNIYSGCRHVFEIQPKKDFLKKAYVEAIKNVNKEVSVPGFRKGKAPEQYIKANFKKAIDSEWQDLATNHLFNMAVELTKTPPRGKESVESVKVNSLTLDGDSDIVIKFESYPKIPEFKVSDLQIQKAAAAEVSDEELEKALHNVLLSHATWEDLPEKAIEQGDWIVLDIDGTQDEKTFEIGRDVKSQALKEQINQWIIDLILGKKAGDVVEGWNQKDELAGSDFKPTFCKITIKTVQKPILPELNAELAEKVKLPNIDDLKPRIRESIAHSKTEEQKQKYHDAIVDQIHEKFVFDVPASFIESDVKNFVNDHIKKLRKENLSEDELKAKIEAYEIEKRKEIENAFRLHLIVQRFANEHKISVTQEEVIGEIVSMIQQDPRNLQHLQSMTEDKMNQLKDRIHSEKTIEKVLNHMLEKLL